MKNILVAGVLALSLGIGTVAHAASNQPGQSSQSAEKSDQQKEGRHQSKKHGHHHMPWIEDAAKVLKMKPKALYEELKSGKSLADVAKEKGITTNQLKNGLQSAWAARLDQAVKEGKLTVEKRDAILLKANQQMDAFIQRKGLPERHAHGFWLNEAAQILNMDQASLVKELQSGKSLVDVAKEKGMTESELKTKLLDAQQTRLTKAVKDGKITEEMKQKITEGTRSHIDEWLTKKGTEPKKED